MKPSTPRKRVLAALLAGSALLALAACDEGPTLGVPELIQRAQESRAKGDLRTAMVDLKSALTKEPQNAQAHLLLGQTYLDFSDGNGAEKEFERAVEAGVRREDVLMYLAESWLVQGQNQKVLDEIKVLPTASQVARAAALNARGRALLNMIRHDDAIAEFEKAREADPQAVGPIVGLARVALEQRRTADATALLKEAQAIAPGDSEVQMLEGDVAYANGDYAASQAVYDKLIEKRPYSPVIAIGLARANLGTGKLDEAAALLDGVLKLNSAFAYGNYLRGLVAFQKQDFESARNFAEKAAEVDPGSLEVSLLLGASAFGMGEYEVARKHLEVVLAAAPGHLTTRRLLAAALNELGERDKALALLAGVPAGQTNNAETLAALADEAIRMGSLPTGAGYLEQAVAADPTDTESREELGLVQIALGNTDQGLAELEEALKAGGSEYRAELGRVLAPLQKRDLDAAMSAAQAWHQAKPDLALPVSFMGMIEVFKADFEAAMKHFDDALAIDPLEPNAISMKAKLLAHAGKTDEARKLIDDALAKKPDEAQLQLELAKIEVISGRLDESVAQLRKILSERPNDLRARRYLALIHLDLGNFGDALSVATGAPGTQEGDAMLLVIAGRAQLGNGNASAATDLLRRATLAAPQDPESYYWLAAAQQAAGDAPGVESSLLKALDLEPNHAPALMAMVRHLASEGRMEDVGAYLIRLRLAAPENPEVMRYDGLYALTKGNTAEGLALLERAQSIEPSTGLVIDITRAKIAAGDRAGALATVRAWNEGHPDDMVAHFEEATLLQADGRYDDAAALYKTILAKSPDSITSLNNLAWVLMLQGKTDDAMTYAQRAYGIDPRDPVVMDTLAALHLKKGRADEALPLLRQAAEALPGDPNVHVHLATALAATGKKDEARDLLQRVLSAPIGDFETRADGEALLAELGG